MKIIRGKRSQIAIFVIIAVIILATIIFFFLVSEKKVPTVSKPTMTDPEQYIEKCARDAASRAIDFMMPQGGYIAPSHYKLYENNKVQYLCYTNLFYETCRNLEPIYIGHLQQEITQNITPVVEDCFAELKKQLVDSGYTVDTGTMSLETELLTGTARVNIDRKFVISKQGETRRFDKFSSVFNSPLYGLAIVAQEIANQEAKYCNFEYVGFMLLYPKFSIDKKAVGSGKESSKIYIIGDTNSGKKLNIAIRSCAFPESF